MADRILNRQKSTKDTYLQRKKQAYVGPMNDRYEEDLLEEIVEEEVVDEVALLEEERIAKEAAEAKRLEEERIAKEAAEAKRLEEERIAKEAAEAKRIEEKRIAKEQEAKRLEEERIAKEQETKRLEEERIAKEQEAKRLEEERIAKEQEAKRLEEERIAKEAEARRLAKEAAEAEARRLAAEKMEELHREQVSVQEAKEVVEDEIAEALIEVEEENERIYGTKKGIINLDIISKNFNAGDVVTVNILKEKKLIDKNICFIKVLARGVLDKPLTIKAQDFSLDAAKMIEVTGGHVVMLTKRKYFN